MVEWNSKYSHLGWKSSRETSVPDTLHDPLEASNIKLINSRQAHGDFIASQITCWQASQ
jgi:hypothetical protein